MTWEGGTRHAHQGRNTKLAGQGEGKKMTQAEKEIKYLRGLIRKMLKKGWTYIDHVNCVFCDGIGGDGFVNSTRHALNCPGNEARRYLKGRRKNVQPLSKLGK